MCAKHRGEIVMPGGSIYEDDFLYVCRRAPPGDGSDTYLGYVMVETTLVARALTAVGPAEHM